jgi:transcriptional pleiotropic regulator of transition state genes
VKNTGMTRFVDNLGRIVIPSELRQTLGINPGDPFHIFVDDNSIILRPYNPGCILCGNIEGLEQHHGKLVCQNCREELVNIAAQAARM